ncbi:hypothetical protein WDU94_010453 [Cyamophila willieti]
MVFYVRMGHLQLLFGILAVPMIQASYMKITTSTASAPAGVGSSYPNQNPQCIEKTPITDPTRLVSCWSSDIQDEEACIGTGCCLRKLTSKTPFCYYPPNFKRVKCLDNIAGEDNCRRKGCHWRPSRTNDSEPTCFKAPSENKKFKMFGFNPPQCSVDSRSHQIVQSENHEIHCNLETRSENSCTERGCCWITNSTGNACIYPKYDFIPCYSEGNVLESTCTAKGCHWISEPRQWSGNPLLSKCFYPLNYKPYRTSDMPQCFDEAFRIHDRVNCEVRGDVNEMNCRAAGCCWQPVLHNTSAHFCYYPWNVKKPANPAVQDLCVQKPDSSDRFDCFPRGIPNEKTCTARGCCWVPAKDKEPSCFYPLNYKSYLYDSTVNNNTDGGSFIYQKNFPSPYPQDIESVRMDIVFETQTRIRVKIYDHKTERYESPYPRISKQLNKTIEKKLYDVEVGQTSFGFAIKRSGSNRILFDTRGVGGFIMADQFLQISAKLLPSSIVYGLGPVSKPLKNNFDWSTFGLFAQDQTASHPFYLSLEQDGKAHGVFLLNSNALEIALQPAPAITYRATGGVLDFYFFMGEKPSDVIMQYLDLIGKPHLPPYWALGYHVYKQGITDVKHIQDVIESRKHPMDVVYGDLSYLDLKSDPTNIAKFKNDLYINGIKYVSILQPRTTSTTININQSCFIKLDSGNENFLGKLNLDMSENAYIDFTHPNASDSWRLILKENYMDLPFNGLNLEKNEPLNLINPVKCPLTRWDDPPFVPKLLAGDYQELKHNTLCMSAVQHAGVHYNLHNLYGISQAHVTYDILKTMLKARPFVLSKSTFAGSGAYSGHWIEYGSITWDTMRQSITDMIVMNMFGVPMVGANAFCKNENDSHLCSRWAALGTFFPLSLKKVYGPDDFQSTIVRDHLFMKYRLLPYLYTVMQKAHRFGHTVVRPLFFEYPNDRDTYGIDDQFLLGESLLIAPVLKENVTVVEAYIPKGLWYKYPSLEKLKSDGRRYPLKAPIYELPMLIKGGSIIVTQTPQKTTTQR